MERMEQEERVGRIEALLGAIASGDLEHLELLEVQGDDALARLERGVNFAALDLQTAHFANQEKGDFLALQQQDIDRKLQLIDAQRVTLEQQQEQLTATASTVERQAASIRELSTPALEVWDDVLVLPIIGVMDTVRSMDIMNRLLEGIVSRQTRFVIVDITGVEVVDTKTADYFLRITRAAGLLGASCLLTGINPAVAQTLVEIGADLSAVKTLRNLKEGLKHCLRLLQTDVRAGGER